MSRPRLTYANVISTLCLFILLGGSAYAATQLPSNSVGTKQLKNRAVTEKKISKSALAGLQGAQGMPGVQGAQGPQGPPGAPGADAHFGEPIPSGATVTGSWNIFDPASPEIAVEASVALPAPAPVPLSDETVNFGAIAGNLASDSDKACVGTATIPTAPPGKLCIYSDYGSASPKTFRGEALRLNPADPPSRVGFTISTGEAANSSRAGGTWAYTAP